jgi:hypothetical protein
MSKRYSANARNANHHDSRNKAAIFGGNGFLAVRESADLSLNNMRFLN